MGVDAAEVSGDKALGDDFGVGGGDAVSGEDGFDELLGRGGGYVDFGFGLGLGHFVDNLGMIWGEFSFHVILDDSYQFWGIQAKASQVQ